MGWPVRRGGHRPSREEVGAAELIKKKSGGLRQALSHKTFSFSAIDLTRLEDTFLLSFRQVKPKEAVLCASGL